MKQNSIYVLIVAIFSLCSCETFNPNDEPPKPDCVYDSQETISFINFGLKVPEYTGQFFDTAFGINFASSDRTIYFLTQVLETKGNQGHENIASAEIRFITDGENCATSKKFDFKAGNPNVGVTSIVAPAPSSRWSGDVKITIRTDVFYSEYDNAAFTVNWTKQENNPDNIVEGNLIGQKLPYRQDPQAIIIPTPIYGGETLN
tara:strand:+ start:652 stop:1260 length:609 start_codon:yes stop_codon:yes gene_type:complete